MRAANFRQVVEEAWTNASQEGRSLSAKLKDCGESLHRWNKESFGNVQKRIKALKKELSDLREGCIIEEIARRETLLASELDEWFARKELLWKQIERMNWLKGGEHNTTYYKFKAP